MRRHLLCAAAAALMLGLPLLWSLESYVPFRIRQPLIADPSGPFLAVDVPELSYLRTREGSSTYRLRLVAIHPGELLRQPEIELRVADYGKTRTILSAEISVPSGNCAYAARNGQAVPNNAFLLFVRRQTCMAVGNASGQEVILTVRLNKPGGMAVWTAPSGESSKSQAALVVADRARSQFAGRSLIGAVGYSDATRGATRFSLLTYVWQIPGRWLAMLMVGAVALIGLSAGLLADWFVRAQEGGRRLALQCSLAALSAALALAVVYACVVPPFQAADETSHFVGLVNLLKQPELGANVALLGQIGHLERIAFHPDEHFNPSDVGQLGGILMVTADSKPVWDVRGRGVFTVWRAFAPLLLRTNSVSTMLLLARLLNAGVFAIAVGFFVCIVTVFSSSRWPILGAFPVFIIPTLPFFGMYVSNYAPLSAVYVVFAASVVLFIWDGPSSYVSGPLMGFSWAAATFLSRSALPLAPVPIGCAVARMMLGPRETSKTGAVVFWMGLAAPSALAIALIPQRLFDLVQSMVAALPTAIRPLWGIMRHPWILVPLGLVASAVELGLHSKKSDDHSRARPRAGGFVASVGYSAAALLALSIALSALVDYPSAPVVDLQHPPSTISYISGMLSAAVTMFRFGHPDFLTSQSFWSGFGWLDTSLPESIVTVLSVGSGAALVFTLVVIARTRASRAGTLLFVVIAGLLAAFVVSSLTVRSTPAALHGRYLLGIYICLITLCWQWLPRTIPEARSLTKTIVLVACGVCVIAIHTVAFATILGRYFD